MNANAIFLAVVAAAITVLLAVALSLPFATAISTLSSGTRSEPIEAWDVTNGPAPRTFA